MNTELALSDIFSSKFSYSRVNIRCLCPSCPWCAETMVHWTMKYGFSFAFDESTPFKFQNIEYIWQDTDIIWKRGYGKLKLWRCITAVIWILMKLNYIFVVINLKKNGGAEYLHDRTKWNTFHSSSKENKWEKTGVNTVRDSNIVDVSCRKINY